MFLLVEGSNIFKLALYVLMNNLWIVLVLALQLPYYHLLRASNNY